MYSFFFMRRYIFEHLFILPHSVVGRLGDKPLLLVGDDFALCFFGIATSAGVDLFKAVDVGQEGTLLVGNCMIEIIVVGFF